MNIRDTNQDNPGDQKDAQQQKSGPESQTQNQFTAQGKPDYDRPEKDQGFPQQDPNKSKSDPGQPQGDQHKTQGTQGNPQIDPQKGNRSDMDQQSRGSSSQGDSWGEKDPSQRV